MIPKEVVDAFNSSKKYFHSPLQEFQFYDKYSRWQDHLGRRETWEEAVQRAVDYLAEVSENKLPQLDYDRIKSAMLNMEAFCSMRLFAMAGPAARRQGLATYNCSYLPVDSVDSIVEALLISMSGCGVGFSVERQYTDRLPVVLRQRESSLALKYSIPDTTEGWCDALRIGLENWLGGFDIDFNYSLIRPAGAVLKIKGGRASGPEPLKKLLDFTRQTILNAQGRKLRPIEVHDIMTMIGFCAVSGGSRRSAMISLFDFDDQEMRLAKSTDFWFFNNPQRVNANNSAVWPEKEMSRDEIAQVMYDMDRGRGGEPGIFNRQAARKTMPSRRSRDILHGGNPCLEIFLRPLQMCNLSQAICRSHDTAESLLEKVEIATVIGTIQSMITNFPGLRSDWRKNCEDERLLGVDLTGQMDCPAIQDASVMRRLREHAVAVNKRYAEILGINQSAAVTCVKPSGNSSVLFDCSPGLHTRYAPYYIRRARVNAHSPIRTVLEFSGLTLYPENGQEYETADTLVVEFPMKAPEGAITNGHRGAIEQCNYWLQNKINWTEHNPSVTIYYREEELEDIIDWLHEHQDYLGGLSFLPLDDHTYQLAPYEKITQQEYERRLAELPEIDFSSLWHLEKEDYTTAASELACVAGQCDI